MATVCILVIVFTRNRLNKTLMLLQIASILVAILKIVLAIIISVFGTGNNQACTWVSHCAVCSYTLSKFFLYLYLLKRVSTLSILSFKSFHIRCRALFILCFAVLVLMCLAFPQINPGLVDGYCDVDIPSWFFAVSVLAEILLACSSLAIFIKSLRSLKCASEAIEATQQRALRGGIVAIVSALFTIVLNGAASSLDVQFKIVAVTLGSVDLVVNGLSLLYVSKPLIQRSIPCFG